MTYDPYQHLPVHELRNLAMQTKAEIKRVENLKQYLSPFYMERDYIMVAIKEYIERLTQKQYAIGRNL